MEVEALNSKSTLGDINDQDIDLRVYVQILKKRRVLIAMVTLFSVIISAIVSFFVLPPVYEAKAVLLVTQAADKLQTTSQSRDPGNIINNLSRIPVLTMNTYVNQVKSDELMLRVIESMGLEAAGVTPRSLAGQVRASAAKDSYLLELTVSNNDRQLAMDIANTLSEEFIGSLNERNTEVMDRSVDFLEKQMAEVKEEIAGAATQAERDRLQGILALLSEGITRTQIARSFDLGSTSLVVVSPAIQAVKVKPNKQLNIAIAFLLGLMASVALAFALEFLDNTIRNAEDVSRYLELPVMGMIPLANNRNETCYGSN